MKIVFSKHAQIKISQRGINKDLVLETVKRPEFVKPSYSFREERYKNFGKNYLKAVVVKHQDLMVVITAHWVAKFK